MTPFSFLPLRAGVGRQLFAGFRLIVFFQSLELLADGLSGTEDVHLHLFLGDAEDGGDVAVGFTFYIAQLHACALLLGQAIDDAVHQCNAVLCDGVVEGCGGAYPCPISKGKDNGIVVERGMLVLHALQVVEGEVVTNGHGETLDVLDFVPALAAVPKLDHRFLYDILCLLAVLRDA